MLRLILIFRHIAHSQMNWIIRSSLIYPWIIRYLGTSWSAECSSQTVFYQNIGWKNYLGTYCETGSVYKKFKSKWKWYVANYFLPKLLILSVNYITRLDFFISTKCQVYKIENNFSSFFFGILSPKNFQTNQKFRKFSYQ